MNKDKISGLDHIFQQTLGKSVDELVSEIHDVQQMSMKDLEAKLVELYADGSTEKEARVYLMELSSRELTDGTSVRKTLRRMRRIKKRAVKLKKKRQKEN